MFYQVTKKEALKLYQKCLTEKETLIHLFYQHCEPLMNNRKYANEMIISAMEVIESVIPEEEKNQMDNLRNCLKSFESKMEETTELYQAFCEEVPETHVDFTTAKFLGYTFDIDRMEELLCFFNFDRLEKEQHPETLLPVYLQNDKERVVFLKKECLDLAKHLDTYYRDIETIKAYQKELDELIHENVSEALVQSLADNGYDRDTTKQLITILTDIAVSINRFVS